MTPRIATLVLLGGLSAATIGMALVAFGVVQSWLFLPGVYLVAIGLLATAIGAVLHLLARRQA